jgi:hypothetical protein
VCNDSAAFLLHVDLESVLVAYSFVERGTLNLTEQQLRDKQRRIQEIILLSQQTNKQPKPIQDQREARMQQNRYTPIDLTIYPRTVYRELPNVPKQRRFHN